MSARVATLYGVETKVFNQRGHYAKYAPLAFIEQGVAMLSSVLKSKSAIEINIGIMRTFVRIRQMLGTNRVWPQVNKLLSPVPVKKNRIGFDSAKK